MTGSDEQWTANVLFDLDGTLIDPAGGITGGIAYALEGMGLPVPEDEVLRRMVGPKLAESLLLYTEVTPDLLEPTIELYRQWYRDRAIPMSRPYPGIETALQELRRAGFGLAVATQKPQGLARVVLDHHGLSGYFSAICGSDDHEALLAPSDGQPAKAHIVAAAQQALGASGPAVMVGDREHDVLGAAANGLPTIGVSWGFAAQGELQDAGAVMVVDDADQLVEILMTSGVPVQAGSARTVGSRVL
ncbi:HAD hydrolase-like protein [Psychromicrobium xiongbiense]|uniref:HAD hydrolase-like protein n=1 Tax=Psychromicrobium xiongbiense TaxID=3051184 RepID=UPI002554F185|nr:HAD hydrolase-like protein [Psychromicrobium sp. YIM S02556]